MSETLTEQLFNVKSGDKVILRIGYAYANRKVAEVKRVTEKQIVIEGGFGEMKFRRDGGREVGGIEGNPRKILPATPELIAEVELENKTKELNNFRFCFIDKKQSQLVEEVYSFLQSKGLIK